MSQLDVLDVVNSISSNHASAAVYFYSKVETSAILWSFAILVINRLFLNSVNTVFIDQKIPSIGQNWHDI